MGKHRTIKNIMAGKPTVEGAGVKLKRAFGYREAPQLDPFLLFDHQKPASGFAAWCYDECLKPEQQKYQQHWQFYN